MISATDIYTFNEKGGGFKLYCKYNLNKVIQALGGEKDKEKSPYLDLMSELGANHEDAIFDHIYDTFGPDKMREFKRDEKQRAKTYTLNGRQKLLITTHEAIKSRIPFIFEPYLCNEISGMNGYIDMLIRIDYFIKMFEKSLPKKIINNLKEEFQKFGKIYIIVDFKYSGLKINKDYSLNGDTKVKKQKIQLRVYHRLLKKFQTKVSQYSFILCPNITNKKILNTRNTLKSIGYFDHKRKEASDIDKKIVKAINWIQNMKIQGRNFQLLPKPLDKHLEPVPTDFDYPYTNIIKEYKKRITENNNEDDLNFPFFDKLCLSEKSYSKLVPFYGNKYTLFIDNETVIKYYTNSFKNFPEMDGCSGAYMIGVVICKNGKDIGKIQFTPNELTEDGIYQVHKDFNNLIINKLGLENISKIYHYGHAELTDFKGFIRDEIRHKELTFFQNFDKNVSLFEDLCKVIKSIKLPITGGNGLKPVAKFFYKHKKITTAYDEMDGLLTIPLIIKYYENKEKYPEIFKEISEYNYKDCVVLKEIVEVLLEHHQQNTIQN
jgi:hypothetical protein